MMQADTLRLALRACMAMNCTIGRTIMFDRKHYFYPDLTPGYQISQKHSPLAKDGMLRITLEDGYVQNASDERDISITQVQLEQDTAKSFHHYTETTGNVTAIDLNRSNSALIEIVSGPDMRTPEQAGAYIRALRELLRSVGASDGNMDEGSMRCDVNVSVHQIDQPWGVRCEVKNVNSVRFAMNAIVHEMHRQHALLAAGKKVEQETRAYNESDGTTERLRSKEDAPDYRYMPDPNLPPLRIDDELLQQVRDELPELPTNRRDRLLKQYGVGLREANVLMRIGQDDGEREDEADLDPVAYYEEVARGRDGKMVINWLVHELLKALNANAKTFGQCPIEPQAFGQLLDLIEQGKVTKSSAKELLNDLAKTDSVVLKELKERHNDVYRLLESRNALALKSSQDLELLCKSVVVELADAARAVRNGNAKVLQRLIGEVMKRSKGRADAKRAGELLKDLIEKGH
jgi:aspartyl-tRNA(Asn)/glutamyl-tRNA(Gln) amidotransferase subunit B